MTSNVFKSNCPVVLVAFNVREDLLQGLGMGTEFEAFIPALDRNIRLKVYYLKDLGTYAAWKATKTTGQFDFKCL